MTDLYEANNQKLNQLNQLSSNPEDMASQDQLDQLLGKWYLQHSDSAHFYVLIVFLPTSVTSCCAHLFTTSTIPRRCVELANT
jgi:hypothetical protein